MTDDLLTELAIALGQINGKTGYRTRAGEIVQVGGSVPDQPETDQIVVRAANKDYSTRVNKETINGATGASSVFTAGNQFEIIGVSSGLQYDNPGKRIAVLLGDIERALMIANTISANGKRYPIQIVSADFSPRIDGANAETVTVTIRLVGPQDWISA